MGKDDSDSFIHFNCPDWLKNMIWTAGFESGMKVQQECTEGIIPGKLEFDKRVQELLNTDADGIMALLNLRREMMGDK